MDDAADLLSCASFTAAPERHQLFLTDAGYETLAMISAWTKFDRPLLILSGPAQIGTTVLATEFAALSSRNAEVGWVSLDGPNVDLSKKVPKAFGIDSADPSDQLARFLAACRRANKKCLLVVDNAHLINECSAIFLEELTVSPGPSKTMYVLLVGRGEVAALLDAPVHEELRGSLGGHVRVQPFAPAETAQYIAHRFRLHKCSCHNGRQPFDAGGLWLIHEASGGYPGNINLLVQHCLYKARASRMSDLDKFFVCTCLAELAEAQQLPYPLPDLPELPNDGHDIGYLPPDAPAVPAPHLNAGRLAAADRSAEQVDYHPARRWLKPGLAGVAAVGLIALGGYVMTSPDSPEERLAETQSVAIVQSVPDQAPEPVADPDLAEADVETRIEERPPDPRDLLGQALAAGSADPEAAIPIFTRAALWGSERAAYYLGQFYETGYGVETDLHTARAWYLEAPLIAGAVARLREIPVTSEVPAGDALPAPVPDRQFVYSSGETELHWVGPAARYRIEFFAAGAEEAQAVEALLPAAVIPQPVSRWRVIALRPDGTPGPTSAWVVVNADL